MQCTKMLRNLSERVAAKFLATTLSYSIVKNAHLKDVSSEIFQLEASPVKGQSQPQKRKQMEKKERQKKIRET